MNPILTVSSSDISAILAYVGSVWQDFNLLILLVIGLPVAFWVVRKGISLVRAR